jgi:hypothetical protein
VPRPLKRRPLVVTVTNGEKKCRMEVWLPSLEPSEDAFGNS